MYTEFTLGGYQALINGFLGRGYKFRSFSDVVANSAHVILRHDLDMSLGAALPLSKIESDLGVRASYFVLLGSEFYNPLSSEGLKNLKEIRDEGHEIGLHFDASGYTIDELDDAVERECEILERALDQRIETISFHRPAKNLLSWSKSIAGRRHTYQPRFFEDIGYCSDSRGDWCYGHPFKHSAVEQRTAIQLLTHPIWWGDPAAKPWEKLNRFLEHRFGRIDEQLARECDVHTAKKISFSFQ